MLMFSLLLNEIELLFRINQGRSQSYEEIGEIKKKTRFEFHFLLTTISRLWSLSKSIMKLYGKRVNHIQTRFCNTRTLFDSYKALRIKWCGYKKVLIARDTPKTICRLWSLGKSIMKIYGRLHVNSRWRIKHCPIEQRTKNPMVWE